MTVLGTRRKNSDRQGVSRSENTKISRRNFNAKSQKNFCGVHVRSHDRHDGTDGSIHSVGERFSCMNISNLGNQELPEVLSEYVESLEFVLGILADTAYNCSAISYKGKLRFTFTSNLRNRDLERKFFTALVKSGVHVKIENTEKEEADD